MKKIRDLLVLFVLCFAMTNVWAQEYDFGADEGIYYDEIISELSVEQTLKNPQESFLDEVKIHLGLSFVNSLFTLNSPDGENLYTSTRGIQFGLGIDLLSDSWIAEGVIRSYGETRDEKATLSASEFDLRVIYLNPIARSLKMRFGAGIGARYLDVAWSNGRSNEYQAPISIFLTGLDFYITDKISLGSDVSARTPMTDESPDDTAIEIALKLDGHF